MTAITAYRKLPPAGSREPREVARVVNRIMDGDLNASGQLSIPFDDFPPYVKRINDVRVDVNSTILLMPMDWPSWSWPMIVTEVGQGYFDISFMDPDDPVGYGQIQGGSDSPSVNTSASAYTPVTGMLEAGVSLNASIVNGSQYTVTEDGQYSISATFVPQSGVGNNQTLDVGFRWNGDDGMVLTIPWMRRSNAEPVPMSLSVYATMFANDYVEAVVRESNSNTVNFDRVFLSMFTIGQSIPPGWGADTTFDMRYLVIG